MSGTIGKLVFCLCDIAFLAAGHCWMAHGNEFAGNIFKFVVWLSFALAIIVTYMDTPVRSDPFSRTWRPWRAVFDVAKVVMTAGFGQFALAVLMIADSLLLCARVRKWDRRAAGEDV